MQQQQQQQQQQVCEKVEPVAYNVSRETLPWPTIKQTLLEEAGSV